MADLFDWSTTAASNTTVDGTNIAEGCAAGNLNNGLRSVMALVRNSFASALKTFLNGTAPLPVANGGTAGTTAADARTALSAAKSGANSDITSLTGMTTALSIAQGGTSATTAAAALTALGGLGVTASSLASPSGYIKLTNGFMLQWKTGTSTVNNSTVSFDQPFTTFSRAWLNGRDTAQERPISVVSSNTTSATIGNPFNSSISFTLFAIGV